MPIFIFGFITIVAVLPGVVWLLFFLKEDIHPEPKKLIIFTFLVGAAMSLPIFVVQTAGEYFIIRAGFSLISVLVYLAFVEEIFKFLAAYWAVGDKKDFDEPIDAMIYMIAVALGLATVENFFILSNFVNIGGVMTSRVVNIVVLRFVGATLLHALASGFVGYFWAKSIITRSKKFLWFGLIFASVFHAFFNVLVIYFQNFNLLLYPALFLLLGFFLLFIDFEKLKKVGEILYNKKDGV